MVDYNQQILSQTISENDSYTKSVMDTISDENTTTIAPTTYEGDYLVQNSNVTIQGGNAILPRYENCTITAINSDLILNATTNSNALIYSCADARINGAQNSYFNISGGSTVVSNSHNSMYNTNSELSFNGGGGFNSITTTNTALIFGNDGTDTLNLILNASNPEKTALFVAGSGNSTLNGGGSTSGISVYAWNSDSTASNLVVTTGSKDDILYGGTGNSTFSGGMGNNLFAVAKDTDNGGKTVITDFAISSGNRIGLFGYGLNTDSVNLLLANSHNDANGNALLNLGNHQITLQGVSINELHANQFIT